MALAFAPTVATRPVETVAELEELPYLADGVELIGQYEDSGFNEAPYLVRRRDGQIIQISELLFFVAEGLDTEGDPEKVAEQVSQAYGREVSADNVAYLVDKKLRPTGLLDTPEADSVAPQRANPLLALKLRLPLVPERIHRRVTTALQPLFRATVVAAALLGLLALDTWLLLSLGSNVLGATQTLIYMPYLLLPMTLLTILMGGFHEIGHAVAARYGGASPGAMGAGIYLVWPVFYTDVTDSYRLDRRGRLRVDLGGIYFNVLFTLAVGGLYVATGHVLFLVFILVAHMETLRQFLPFVRLDGYYIVSDLAGVPNLFAYLQPALARFRSTFRRGQGAHRAGSGPGLDQLTRRARTILLVWACVTVPVLLVNVVFIVMFAPQLAGAAWGSAGLQIRTLADAFGNYDGLAVLNGSIGLFFLLLPAAGMTYIAYLLLGRVAAKAKASWPQRPVITGAFSAIAIVAIGIQVGTVWPSKFTEAASQPSRSSGEGVAMMRALASGSHLAVGVLTVVVPKAETAKARRVEITG